MMSKRSTLILFYSCVALISAGILVISFSLRARLPKPDIESIVNQGKVEVKDWFPIGRDLEATNQEGRQVRLSDLKGKVWLVAEFFAVCPHCAVRNGAELRAIYDQFKDNPDFQIVCISIDPENDDVNKLRDYAAALGADASDWWFLNAGDLKETHRYLEEELKFFGVRNRKDPADIEANGRFAHDLGFILVDREFRVLGKWPLADARSPEAMAREPQMYERMKAELFDRIRKELETKAAAVGP